MYYVLKSSQVLDLIVPILYHLNNSRNDQCKLVFSLLRDVYHYYYYYYYKKMYSLFKHELIHQVIEY